MALCHPLTTLFLYKIRSFHIISTPWILLDISSGFNLTLFFSLLGAIKNYQRFQFILISMAVCHLLWRKILWFVSQEGFPCTVPTAHVATGNCMSYFMRSLCDNRHNCKNWHEYQIDGFEAWWGYNKYKQHAHQTNMYILNNEY